MNDIRHLINLLEEISNKDDELQAIIARARENGVELNAEMYSDNTIGLVDIERTSGPKGAGKQALAELCDFADKYNMEIILHVAGGMYKLAELYRSFGFEFSESDDDEDHPEADEHSMGYDVEMYRIPRS